MAVKEKKKKQFDLQASALSLANAVKKPEINKTSNNKTTVSTKSTIQKQNNNLLTINSKNQPKQTLTTPKKDNRTVKTANINKNKKSSIATFDVYERGGKYYYSDNGKEHEIDKKYLQSHLDNNIDGVVGVYDKKGNFTKTNRRGVVKAEKKEKKTIDQRISDIANAVQNTQGYRNLKTAGNIMTQMGHGAARSVEGVLDFANAISNSINNPLEQKAKVGLGLRTEEEALKERQEAERQQSNWDARNLTDEALQKLGWNEDLYKQWENGSLVRRDNMAGQIAEGIGGMVPSLVAGQALGFSNIPNTSLKGLKGTALLKGIGRNVGTGILSNAGGSAVLGASAYGSGYEEALNEGATPEQARRYGALNAGTEFATEMITGGIPGLQQTGILDNMADGLIDRATGKVTNKFLKKATAVLLKEGYTIAGEGFEEALADIINPLIKNATYTDGEKIDWHGVLQSAIAGGIIGGILGGGNASIEGINLANQQIQELNTIADQRIQQIQEEVQQDPSRAQEATQEIQDIQNYVQAQTNIIQNQAKTQAQESETPQPNAITQETQNVAQNELNEDETGRTDGLMTNDEKALAHINDMIEKLDATSNEKHPKFTEKEKEELRQNVLEMVQSNREYIAKKANKNNINEKQESEKKVVKTKQKQNGVEKEGRKFRKMFFSDEKYGNLNDNEIAEYAMLKDEYDHTSSLPKSKIERVKYLNRKGQGLKYPELNNNIKSYDDIKEDYKYIKNFNSENFDDSYVNKALDTISANNQGRRTKEQWLDVAKNIGTQAENLDSDSLKKLAFESWAYINPNKKENLNRQGSKYVQFTANEWIKAVYDGAGVGTKTKQQSAETKPKVENKKVTKMDIQYGDHNDPRIIVGRQASTAYNKTLDQYKMQVEYLTKDAKQAIEDYGGIEKLWKDAQTMSQVEIANNFGNTNVTTQETTSNQQESTQKVTDNNKIEEAKKAEEKQKAKDSLKAIKQQIDDFVKRNASEKGELTKEGAEIYEKMMKEYSNARYDYETKHLKEISESNIKDDRKTSLDKKVYVQARKDTLKNKDVYDAIESAAHGVHLNADTAVDDIMNGKNKNVSPEQLYNAFSETRKRLHEIYGDKITLYRVEGKQKAKATKNYGSSIEYTKQYGDDVKKYEIDIDDIVAINTNRTGTYEDIIVAQGGIDKYINRIENNNVETNKNENIPAKVDNNVIAEKITNNINNAIKGKDVFEEIEKATGKPIRRGVKTITTATGTTELVSTMDGSIITYEPQSNDKTLNKAREAQKDMSLDEKYQDCLDFINSDKRIKAVDIAKIELTLQELQKNGEADKFSNLVQYASTLGTTDAQALQMMSVIKKMNPMTQLETLQKLIQKEQSKGNKIYDGVKINKDLVKKVLDTQKANGEVNQVQFYAAMEELKNDIAKQMKSTKLDKANAFRYIAMLGNPKTHIRNVLGNGFMFGLQSFKDVLGTVGEVAYDTTLKATGKEGMQERTKTFNVASKEVRDFVNNKVDDFFKKNKMKNKYNESMKGLSGDLESRRDIFSNNNIIGKALNKVSNINNAALDNMDKFFASSMTKKAMKNYLTANGIRTNKQIESNPEIIARALDYALFKGKEATFHQDSTTASMIRNAREKARSGSGYTKAIGLAIDATMPFVSTPVNIAKNAMEYTPIVGFGDLNTQLKNSPKELRGAIVIDNLSKQFAGLSLLGLGIFLAATGKIKGAGDDDKEDKIEKNLGNAQYSIKLGNSTYDLSWISPSAVPLFEGVEIYNKYGKNKKIDVGTMVDTFFGALNPVTDMSVLQSIEKTLTSLAYGKNATQTLGETTLSSYLSQYIPTISSQFAQWFDTKQRDSNTGSNALEKTWDQIKYKIPGARNTLPEKVNIWGETNKTAENFWQRGFEAFLSPANRKDYKVDSTTKELERVARETGETGALPTEREKSQKIGGEIIQLSGKDYTDFKKAYGKNSKTQVDSLIKTREYKNADDVTKKKMIADIYQYAIYEAKKEYGDKHNIEVSADAQKYALADAFNIPYYKLGGLRISDIKADKNSKGISINGSAKKKAIDLINKTDLTTTQKAAIISQKWKYKYDSSEFNRIIDSSNLSREDKNKLKEKLKS